MARFRVGDVVRVSLKALQKRHLVDVLMNQRGIQFTVDRVEHTAKGVMVGCVYPGKAASHMSINEDLLELVPEWERR